MAQRTVQSFGIFTSGGVEKTTWKVLDVQLGIDGAYSEAGVALPETLLENWTAQLDPDARLFVKRDTGGTPAVVFKGRGLKPLLEWGMNFEGVSATFLGPEWDLDRAHVWGQWANTAGGTPANFSGLPTIFNPGGQKNKVTGSRLFEPDLTASSREHWSVKQMVLLLLERFDATVESGLIDYASISWPTDIDSHLVFGVKVQGLTYREAITEILSRAGYSWALKAQDDLTNAHDMLIFRRGDDTGAAPKDVYLPAHADSLSTILEGNRIKAVPEGVLNLDHAGVVTQMKGYGDVKVYESTFTLLKGWSAADEASVFSGASTKEKIGNWRRISTRDSDSFASIGHVGRRYILNETGREDTNPASTWYDFSTLFGTVHTDRPRPFLPHRMTKDSEGNYLPPKVLVDDQVYGGGSGAKEGEYNWRLLEEIAGIFFEGGKVPYDAEKALQDDDYEAGFPNSVKIVAAVEADAALESSHSPTSPDLTTTVVRVLDLQAKYQWDNIGGSTSELDTYVEQKGDQHGKRQDVGRLLINEIVSGFDPGDWLDNIDPRTIALHAQIVGIRWGVDEQVTELFLETMEADATRDRPQGPPGAVGVPSHGRTETSGGHQGPTKEQIEAYNEYMRRRGISIR